MLTSNINIYNTEFIINSVSQLGGQGGVVFASGSSEIKLKGSTFRKNLAIYGDGAVMYLQGSLSNIRGSEFSNNQANQGAVLSVNSVSTVKIDDCRF